MTKDELISKQQLESNREVLDDLRGMFYSIGQPLNDNKLKFNRHQLKWCLQVYSLIETLQGE